MDATGGAIGLDPNKGFAVGFGVAACATRTCDGGIGDEDCTGLGETILTIEILDGGAPDPIRGCEVKGRNP